MAVAPPLDPCAQVDWALAQSSFPTWLRPIMAAIARAESGCRAEATAQTPQEYSVGPYQINLRAHPWVDEACARDPLCATEAAYRIWTSQGLGAWTTWRTGAWRRFAALDVGPLAPTWTPLASLPPSPVGQEALRAGVWIVALLLLGVGLLALRGRRVEV